MLCLLHRSGVVQVVPLAAGDGTPGFGFGGLSPLFAPAELRALLEAERRAEVAAIAAEQGPFVQAP